jgi:hypothetical protein
MRAPLTLLFFVCAAFAQGYDSTEGGNITALNASSGYNSTWHGACGQASTAAFVPVSINATPGDTACLTVNTGAGVCTSGVERLYLLFSNSSSMITSLSAGNLTALDAFINREGQNGSSTFVLSTTFETANFGTIGAVPTTYTNPPVPATFRLGYLTDQAGNLVFITPVVEDQAGFNGSLFDFQLMLPTNNGTPTMYYAGIDLACNPQPPTNVTPPGPGGGGGGTHTPYYPPSPPVPPVECLCGEVVNGTCVEYECCSDDGCAGTEYCDIPAGGRGGVCRPVEGCGVAENHALIPYQCGTGPACPPCAEGFVCQNHTCTAYGLEGPDTGFIGSNVTIEASENGGPCAFCGIEVVDPAGNRLMGRTDANGTLRIPLTIQGIYTVTLFEGGTPLKSMNITALPVTKPQEPEKPVAKVEELCLPWLVLVILLAIVIYLVRKHLRQKKRGGK